ncbi:MAG TPA: RNA polymerase sigma factor [Gemmatimonadaceae bacterium]|nr:RNA polymerase sigma factor [Gemmatimonadaceae bacterium]
MLAATFDVMSDAAPPTPVGDAPTDVSLAAAGDRRAFERLYRTHVNHVFSVCVRMCGDRARAEELTQDVFVRVWEKLPLFRGESAFSTWLHRLAVNVVLNERKVESRERSRSAPDAGADDDDGDAYGASAPPSHADRMDLETAIATLPPGARKVFVLHDVEGFKHEEIAEMLGVTSGGSKAQLHRARLLLREALQR